MKTPILETKRLILRPVSLDDAPAIQKYFNNWNIIKNLSLTAPWPYPQDGAEAFLRDIALPAMCDGKAHIWGIHIKNAQDHGLIGVIDYRYEPDKEGNRGFWLGEPFWGKGYMSEAVMAVQDYLFLDLGIDSMIVTNVRSNAASRRVKEKTGARYLRTEKIEHRCDNESEVWEITRDSWRAFRNKKTV